MCSLAHHRQFFAPDIRPALRRHGSVWTVLAAAIVMILSLAQAPSARAANAPDVRPCDIYASGNTPCVAAHSTTRALYAAYSGRLYQVLRTSDNTTLDIGVTAAGGYANAAAQDAFCANTRCKIMIVYDQSPQHNDLTVEGGGGGIRTPDVPASADALPVTAGGQQVYGISFTGGIGYRDNATTGVAKNGQPEGMYMVTSGTHFNDMCCFDYGNTEDTNYDTVNGHMDAINFSNECWFGQCPGNGPWVQADLENGLFLSSQGISQSQDDRSRPEPFVTAILKNNGQNFFALRSANAQSGGLRTDYAGPEPTTNGYAPMHQEGGIVLGTGGDNGNLGVGSFFEGAMTAGLPTDAIEDAVQANIVGVNYGGPTGSYGALTPGSEVSILRHSGGLSTYVRRQNNNGTQMIASQKLTNTSAVEDRLAATWIVRRGLANNSCVSFESKDRPGEFIRHYAYILYVQPFDGSNTSAADATFCPVKPLDGQTTLSQTASTSMQAVLGQSVSLQSYNFPDRYFRIYLSGGYIGAATGTARIQDGGNTFRADTSFAITAPLAP